MVEMARAARSTKASVSIVLVASSLFELFPISAAPKREEADVVVGAGSGRPGAFGLRRKA